jgi:hypothetical protein
MRRLRLVALLLALFTMFPLLTAQAQIRWVIGGRLGMSLGTLSSSAPANDYYYYYYGYTPAKTSSTSAGLQIGPTAEVIFAKQFAVTTEFNINTEAGTPIEWANTFKAYFLISGSKILPYADGGFGLLFVTGGPYFGIRAGGGALFPIARNLYIPADLQLGLYFGNGLTLFWLAVTSGIRYFI